MDDVLVEIHKHIARVVIQRYNNFLTTLATAGSQHVSRQVSHKCNEVMMEKHRCWCGPRVHLLVPLDPEKCKYHIFAVTKKEL